MGILCSTCVKCFRNVNLVQTRHAYITFPFYSITVTLLLMLLLLQQLPLLPLLLLTIAATFQAEMKHYCNTDFLQDIRDLKDRQLIEWWHSGSPSTSPTLKKKFRVPNSNGKLLALIFWDQDGILLIDYFPKDTSTNTEYYSSLLVLLKTSFQF